MARDRWRAGVVAAPARGEGGVIAGVRGLVVLALIGLALLVVLVVDRGGPSVVDRAVVPRFDPAKVRQLVWTAPSGGEGPEVVRRGDGWTGRGDDAKLDTRAVDDLLSSLRGARWHRRDPHRDIHVHRTLAVDGGTATHSISIGDKLAGTEQAWIRVDGGPALLVDDWLANLLDPGPLAFRDRAPLAAAASSTITLEVAGKTVELHAQPWRTHDGLVAPALGDALATALAGLVLAGPAPRELGAPIATIALANGPRVQIGGACPQPEQIAISVDGAGACIAASAWGTARAAGEALLHPAADVLDRRPAGFAIDHIGLVGATLSLVRRPTLTFDNSALPSGSAASPGQARLGGRGATSPADPDRVAELVHTLAEPGEPIAVPATAPAFTLSIAPVRGDAIVLDVFPDAVHRRGEALALRITATARAILGRPATTLLDPERWAEDPSTITTLVLDDVTYHRGVVIGEWSREPAGALDPAIVEAVAQAAAKLRAPGRTTTGPSSAATPHHLRITFAPPVGDAVTRELALGSPGPDGCPALLGTEPVTAPLSLCTAVAALAR
jgi:hypothetical protein